jgi:four helix bundle protein
MRDEGGEMRHTFIFHKLQVWHLAKELARDVYNITKEFPIEEKFGLVTQINRAAISVASNIAEGSGRTNRKDQAHFTQLAYGSLMEVACQLEIATDLHFIAEDEFQRICASIKVIAEKLSALRSSQLSSLNSHPSSRV